MLGLLGRARGGFPMALILLALALVQRCLLLPLSLVEDGGVA